MKSKDQGKNEPFFITEDVAAELTAAGYEFVPPGHARTASIRDLFGWQRDALRRLATQAALKPTEIDELASICKGDNPAAPLEAGHLRGPNRDQGEVYLRQVHGVRHVNALAPDQRLTLHRVGLTIIYGDNGSGKSGYARILKKVCRARMPGRAEDRSRHL